MWGWISHGFYNFMTIPSCVQSTCLHKLQDEKHITLLNKPRLLWVSNNSLKQNYYQSSSKGKKGKKTSLGPVSAGVWSQITSPSSTIVCDMIVPPRQLQQLSTFTGNIENSTGNTEKWKCSSFDAYSILRIRFIKTFLLIIPSTHCSSPLSLSSFCAGIFVQWSGCSSRSWLCVTGKGNWEIRKDHNWTQWKNLKLWKFPFNKKIHTDKIHSWWDLICQMWARD